MHEQNFEKQVQQKMEELSLTPSAPVWQKVEEQIRKKKDRRRLLFWLLPLLMVVGGSAGWMIWSTGKGAGSIDSVQITHQPVTPVDVVQEKAVVNTAPGIKEQDQTTKSTGNVNDKDEITAYKQPGITAKPPKLTTSLTTSRPKMIEKEGLSPTDEITSEEKTTKAKQAETISNEEVETLKEVAANREEESRTNTAAPDTAASSGQEVITNKVPEITPPAAPATTLPLSEDSATLVQKEPVKKKPSRWLWTAHAEGGVASVWSSLFELPSTRSQFMYSSPAQYSGGNFFAYYPSPQEEGPAFAAGFTAKRILNARTKLTAGVQYNFYSTTMAVGQEKNASTSAMVPYARQSSAADNSYLPGTQNQYRNRYHFIQLPIGIEYQVLRKIPLQVHGGLSVAQLVSTNALLYDYNAQAYYQNSRAFNTTQLHLFTNLTYPVWKRKAVRLDLGPYVQYSLTELQKKAPDKNRLFSTGLRTQFSF